MPSLAEIMAIYRQTLVEDLGVSKPLQPLGPDDPNAQAYDTAQKIAGNATGQTTKAQQDLSAAKEEVPVDPSERTPQQKAQLAKAKQEIMGLPLGQVTSESRRSSIFSALMELDQPEDDTYKRNLLASLHALYRRHRPSSRKIIHMTSGRDPALGDRLYAVLYPRIVKWDFPDRYSLRYQDMLADLTTTLDQASP
jgi:hypothetical protein